MFETNTNRRALTKWIVGTFTCCIVIYLAIRHIKNIADAIVRLVALISPLLLGVIVALILNVPMISAERFMKWLEDYKSYTEDWDYEENFDFE